MSLWESQRRETEGSELLVTRAHGDPLEITGINKIQF